MKLQKLLFLFFLIFSNLLSATNRILYVDNFNNILGSYNLENKLLEFSRKNDIHTLILYELDKVNKRLPLSDSLKNGALAKFISRAKLEYNIKEISASGESGDFFLKAIHPYNKSRKKAEEKFDVYNLEYEYWYEKASSEGGYYCETYLKKGQLPCNRKGSFTYYIEALTIMKLLAEEESHPVKIEAYIGKFTKEEALELDHHLDRLLIHAYVKNPDKSYNYTKERLKLLSELNSKISISIIFSSEMNFMGRWLSKNDFKKAEEIFFKELNKDDKDDKELTKTLNFEGFTYYNYSYYQKSLNNYKKNNRKIESNGFLN